MRMNKNSAGKKPFPWTCSKCRQKALVPAIVDYSVDVGHDGRRYHVKVDGLNTPKCKNCGLVSPDREAHEQVTLAFLHQAGLLTPEQIRANREALKLTQVQFAAALGIAEATVSRWENGVQIQQRSLDNLLRLFFGVPKARSLLIQGTLGEIDLVARPEALSIP